MDASLVLAVGAIIAAIASIYVYGNRRMRRLDEAAERTLKVW